MGRASRYFRCAECGGPAFYQAPDGTGRCREHRPPLRTDVPVSRFAEEPWPEETA